MISKGHFILPTYWHYLMISTVTLTLSSVARVESVPLSTTLRPVIVEKSSHIGTLSPALGDVVATVAKSVAPAVVDTPTHSPSAPGSSASLATTSKPAATSSKSGADKMNQFLAPICEQLDKIVPKQAFKVQSQFKQIIERTSGKLSICFMKHYKIDPSMNPISKTHMVTLCHSKANTQPDSKWKAFLVCAADNWDTAADKELDRIIKARDEHVKNHKHDSKEESGAPSLLHGDDEFSTMLNDVVAKAFTDGKSDQNPRSDIKLIDLSDKTTPSTNSSTKSPATVAPMTTTSSPTLSKSSTIEPKLLNDPNTLMVFVDDSKTKPPLTTVAPHTSTNLFGLEGHSTAKPHPVEKTKSVEAHPNATVPKASIHSTSKPQLGTKQASIATPTATSTSTTIKPHPTNHSSSTNKPVISNKNGTTSAPPHINGTSSKTAAHLSTTLTPISLAKTTPKPTVKMSTQPAKTSTMAPKSNTVSTSKPTTTSLPLTKSTEKPLETLSAVLKKQEVEKQEFEKKLKAERESLIKKLKKKQDEIDAQNAILAMQTQRNNVANYPANHDNRMHQIEHERQMAIDPIGHTIKHQQHELKKQRLMQNSG